MKHPVRGGFRQALRTQSRHDLYAQTHSRLYQSYRLQPSGTYGTGQSGGIIAATEARTEVAKIIGVANRSGGHYLRNTKVGPSFQAFFRCNIMGRMPKLPCGSEATGATPRNPRNGKKAVSLYFHV